MSYLLDKKIQKKKFWHIGTFVFIVLVLFYFRLNIFNGLATVSSVVFRPVFIVGNYIGEKFSNLSAYFISKSSLYLENQNLQAKLNENNAQMANYNSILDENISLKEILGRKDLNLGAELPRGSSAPKFVLSAILSKPSTSPYDTLIIDAGINKNLKVGDMVFALGNVPIGRVSDVYSSSAKVVLFSSSGEKIQAVVSGGNIRPNDQTRPVGQVFTEIVGRGGGNFEMILPRDLAPIKGDAVVLPGITPYVVGVVETIISDPRDPFIKTLLSSPVNIQELKFVQIEVK